MEIGVAWTGQDQQVFTAVALLRYPVRQYLLLACIAYRHSEKIGRPTFDTTAKQTLVSARKKISFHAQA